MGPDLNASGQWLELLHGQSTGFIHVCSTGQWTGAVCENVDQALAYIKTIDLRQPPGIYLRVTTIGRQLQPGERGHASDSVSLPGLWADIDIAGPGHKSDQALVPDEQRAVQIVTESGLPEPSLWIHSGGGLYPWWLLDKPRNLVDHGDLEEVQWLSETWQDLLRFSAKQLGWHYGTEVKDLARVLRVPGTINRKVDGNPRPCRVADELGGATRYTLDDLYDAAMRGLPKVEPTEKRAVLPARIVDPGEDGVTPGDALEAVPWDDPRLLGGADWQIHHQRGDTTYWTRPGKSLRDGYSATTGYDSGRDRLYVFTSSTPLPSLEPLNKFAVYALLNHGGNFEMAAGELRRDGLGGLRTHTVPEPPAETWHPQLPAPQAGATLRWARYSLDDMGNGQRFSARYQENVRWMVDAEQWVVRTGGRWKEVTDGPVDAMVQKLVDDLPHLERELYSDEPGTDDKGKPAPSERELFEGWIRKQRFDARLRAMKSCAKGRLDLHASGTDFDADPLELNCRNGVLDLRTGTLRPHQASDMFMLQANVNWDENAQCPRWLEYLERTIKDNQERAYLQRVTGYSITGKVNEQAMFIHFGFGANGKSVYLEVLGQILGTYSIVVNSGTLMQKPYEGNHNADVARMAKKRFFRVSETNVGKRLDEGQVKLLTGGDDSILARYPYQRLPFEFYPTGKIHLATNHHPDVSDADSIWRRIHLIGWDVTIPTHERNKNLSAELLATERAGILTWAVQGCLEWQQLGELAPPNSSELRVMEYRGSQSVFGEFLEDCVKRAPGGVERFSRLYQIYRNWCDQYGARSMSGKAFSAAMQERGYVKWRDTNHRGFRDITAVTPMQSELDWRQGT